MSDYLADDGAIDGTEFTRLACDPRASAVVEACAGSGKTWLLVSRLIRLLLAGAAPGEILAITFTRRAAQEMRVRLMQDLRHLAAGDDDSIVGFLCQRGMTVAAAHAAVEPARQLYERVVTARVPLTIETFHGWFWQLIVRAPLGAGVPFAPVLLEESDRARSDAWLHFCAALVRAEHAGARAAWEQLLDDIGESSAQALLMRFLERRAEWWSYAGADEHAAMARTLTVLRGAGDVPYARVRGADFVAALHGALDLWRSVSDASRTLQQHCDTAQRWLVAADPDPATDFRAIGRVLLTRKLTVRKDLAPDWLASRLGARAERYAELHALMMETLERARVEQRIHRARRLNEAGLACGRLLIEQYQRLKTQQQALDFNDLEWHAHRLLSDADNAAYMQARLDARYRHLLVDEFQDTNPLQWQVLQAWLTGYGALDEGDAAPSDRPTLFVVGDPKQSIYRFRRAEPRVFDAALELLARDFAAVHLRTNVTRRNAQEVIDVLNACMPGGNPLYQHQSTLTGVRGAFVLLPLAQRLPTPPGPTDGGLRDVLAVPRVERDSELHYREGRAIASEIAARVAVLDVMERGVARPARWADVLVLLRRRTHLADYERAFRDAGVPFVSDRRGGLLATLEVDDLTALLQWLIMPSANLKLAHALRSPIFGASDTDLVQLAATSGSNWWQRLLALGDTASPGLVRARELLTRWHQFAGILPMHDLLDRIYFEGDVRSRYAAVAPTVLHAQVQANLDAFLELALAVDSGRYPSLPRFIDELSHLKRSAGDDAPDEGMAATGDAVRLMTIHGAKGLEADIVAVADANAPAGAESESILIVWPPHQPAPEHISLVARGGDARDVARASWFAEEDAQAVQEEWNLLYVAATRARQVLIVSGSMRSNGSPVDSWYSRLQAAAAPPSAAVSPSHPVSPAADIVRSFQDFRPEPLPTGRRLAVSEESSAMKLGSAWHALLESGDPARLAAIAHRHGLSEDQAQLVSVAAARVRGRLPHLFASGEAELDLVAEDGQLLRVDRLVEHEGALWIVDFKWSLTEAQRLQYEAQLQRYAAVLRTIRPQQPIRVALVTAEGEMHELA
jgi:ATP-dependent helicase/nuclease subunit A